MSIAKKSKNINCLLINVNLDKHHFDSFAEIIKTKNSLFNVIKNKLSNKDELIARLSRKIKEMHNTFLELLIRIVNC